MIDLIFIAIDPYLIRARGNFSLYLQEKCKRSTQTPPKLPMPTPDDDLKVAPWVAGDFGTRKRQANSVPIQNFSSERPSHHVRPAKIRTYVKHGVHMPHAGACHLQEDLMANLWSTFGCSGHNFRFLMKP